MQFEKQQVFCLDKNVVISSKFESGNLAKVVLKSNNHYDLWIGPDHYSSYKTWFYFSIDGIQANTTITFTINNFNNQVKLFKEDHLPVFREDGTQNWERIKIPIQQNGFVKGQDGFQLTFKHHFVKKIKTFFAFSYPWTIVDSQNFIKNLIAQKSPQCFTKYEDLTFTLCKRTVKILTLSVLNKETKWKQIQIFNEDESSMKPMIFQGKKGIFISARVHPGEIASSYILNGILLKLFNGSQQSKLLLEKFVFYIVPIINPDGVDQGNFRTDSKGKNLNRCYIDPNKTQEPQIYAIKKFLIQMIKNDHIEFCLDLHAHVNKQGAFIYGNSIDDLKSQIQVCLFPKILAFNCPYFDYDGCNFSQKNMSSKDKADDLSKQGASRVAIFKETGLKACWTLQCNYNSCKYVNQLKNLDAQSFKNVSNGILTQNILPTRKEQKTFLTIKEFHQIGEGICESILDYYGLRQNARYFTGKIKNRENFLISLAVQVLRLIPFRFDNNMRKILNMINSNMNLSQNLGKIKILLKDFKVGEHPKYFSKQLGKKIDQLKSNNAKNSSVRKISSQDQKRGKFNQDIKKPTSIKRKFSVQKPQQKKDIKGIILGKPIILKGKTQQTNLIRIPPKPIPSITRKV